MSNVQIPWKYGAERNELMPHVEDLGYEERTLAEIEKVFKHVSETGKAWSPKSSARKGLITFWRTEVKQMGKTEFALNTAFGTIIAVAGLAIPGINAFWGAFLVTAALTILAGKIAGNVTSG